MTPDNAELPDNLGLALAERGKAEEAARAISEAPRLRPDSADARKNLAGALQTRGQHQ